MNGFIVRVAAVCDRTARELQGVSNTLEREGLPAQALLLRTVCRRLGALAVAAARDASLTCEEIAEQTYDAHRATVHCASMIETLFPDLGEVLRSTARVIARINRDASAETQPIDPRKLK